MSQIELTYDVPLMTEDETTVWRILERLPGRGYAIRSEDLQMLTGISTRAQRYIIRRLRIDFHHPIGSTTQKPAGYYLCKTPAEIQEFTDTWWNFGIQQLFMVSQVRRFSITEMLNQVKLDFRDAAQTSLPPA